MTGDADARQQDRGERHRRGRKTRDRAVVLVVVGLVLLMPPMANAFQSGMKVFGIPFTLIYLFVVWAGLIVCAVWLAPGLKELDERGQDQGGKSP